MTANNPSARSRAQGALVGLAVGDAAGFPSLFHRTTRMGWRRSVLWRFAGELDDQHVGCSTRAWSIWGDDRKTNLIPHSYPTYAEDDVMRVQGAALLAGAGIHYGAGMYDQYIRWSKTLRAQWHQVLRTVNVNKALLPSASRTRVPAGSGPNVYAMRRTSADGTQTALLVYNFNVTATTVTVDLTGTGIGTSQVPADLYNGGRGPAINGESYPVSLPAYGFAILQVS